MTTNILVDESGREPIRSQNEYFILRRSNISYRIIAESKIQYNGEGYLILTSNRLVLFNTRQRNHYNTIEIPLSKIYQEEYKQPLFGKNYLAARCRPVFASPFGAFSFTIWFRDKNVGTLIGAFYTLIDSLRNNNGRSHDLNVMNSLQENNFNELFAIDQEDNSFIYQIQPPPANIPKENYKSVINNNKFGQLNEEQNKREIDLYMSSFISRNINNNSIINNHNSIINNNNFRNNFNGNNSYINWNNNNNNSMNINNQYMMNNNNNNNNNMNINNQYVMNNNNNNYPRQNNLPFNQNNSFQNNVNMNQNNFNNINNINNPNYDNNSNFKSLKTINDDDIKENANNFIKINPNEINNVNNNNNNNLKNQQNLSLLQRINSDDLIPDSNVVNPYH